MRGSLHTDPGLQKAGLRHPCHHPSDDTSEGADVAAGAFFAKAASAFVYMQKFKTGAQRNRQPRETGLLLTGLENVHVADCLCPVMSIQTYF